MACSISSDAEGTQTNSDMRTKRNNLRRIPIFESVNIQLITELDVATGELRD